MGLGIDVANARCIGRRLLVAALMGSTCIGATMVAMQDEARAQGSQQTTFNIPAGPLSAALAAFGRQSGVQVAYVPEIASGKRSAGISGPIAASEALAQLLAGTGLSYRFTNTNTVTIIDRTTAAPIGAEGSLVLDTINVSGGAGAFSADAPYETAGSSNYIGQEQIERFRGSSPADILHDAPGVYSGQSRASGGLDVNIRGLQGQGRVAVTVDGAQNSTALYRGYQGISNATFIDPDFIGGVLIEKGASTGPGGTGAIGGTVSMRTVTADDIIPEGDSFGMRIKVEGSSNTTSPWTSLGKRHLATPGDRSQPDYVWRYQDSTIERPSFLDLASGSASIVMAGRSENLDLVGGFSRRKSGNYHAGEQGSNAPHLIQCDPDAGFDCGVDWYTKGLSIYLPGEEVLNTSQDVYSGLLKATMRFGDDHTWDLGYSYYNSVFGEQYPMDLSSDGGTTYQRNPSSIEVNSYTSRYRWNPANDLIDLRWNVWATSLDETTHGNSMPVSKESQMRGTDISNTSRFDTSLGALSMQYGLSYLHEETRPTELNGNISPRDGKRWEASAFTNASWQATDWLQLDGGLRYHRFESENLAPGNTDPVQKNDAVDYSATVTLTPFEGVQVYGSYKNASRLPSLFEATGGFATTVDPNLRPETARSWEFGTNISRDNVFADDDSVRFKLGYFDTQIDDYINRRAVGAGRMHIANIAQANFSGFDLSARYELGGFSAELGGSYYTDVEYCRTLDTCINSSLASDYATNYVPPEYSVNLTLSQKLLEDRLTLSGRLRHIGPRAGDAETPGSGGATLLAQIPWKPYTLIDISAEYKITDYMTLNMAIENLTDVYYVEPLSLARVPSPGRTVRIGLTGELSASTLAGISGADAPVAYDWSGLYAGVHAAAGRTSYEAADFSQNGMYPQHYLFESTKSYAGGVQLGYNHQFSNNLVFGIEGEFSLLQADKLMQITTRERQETKANWLASVRGKVGYALGDILIYGTGGYAVADIEGSHQMATGRWGNFEWPGTSASARFSGWMAGGGIEYALTENISVKGEYSFTNLAHGSLNPPTFNDTDFSWNLKPRIDQVKLGLNYRF